MAGEQGNQGQGQGQGQGLGNEPQFELTGDELRGFELKLPTGQVYRGKDQGELLNALVKAQVHGSLTIQEKERQLQDTRRIIEDQERDRRRLESQGQGQGGGDQFNEEQFNQRFYELINTRPLEAMDFLNRTYYGMDNPRAAFQKSAAVAEYVSDAVATKEFLNDNLDFPATPENGEVLLREVLDRNLDITSYNLERVWKDMKKDPTSRVRPTAPQQGQGQGYGQGQGLEVPGLESGFRQAPPPMPGSQTAQDGQNLGDDIVDKFSQLSHAQKQEYLRKNGLL